MKYRQQDESFDGKIKRIAGTLCDGPEHQYALEEVSGEMRFLPAGRVQSAIGSARITTAYNCFVSGLVEDSMDSIMGRAHEAAGLPKHTQHTTVWSVVIRADPIGD